MVPNVGFELTTYCLQDSCSTTELIRQKEEFEFSSNNKENSSIFLEETNKKVILTFASMTFQLY